MGRVLAIDYGLRQSGVAVTDPLRLSVNGLKGINTQALEHFVCQYMNQEEVDVLVIGLPVHKDGTPTYLEENIQTFIGQIRKKFPDLQIERVDESFTTHKAMEIMIESKVPKMRRRNKSLVDKVSAMVILRQYLDSLSN
jgi:putative holliday junction resolvase